MTAAPALPEFGEKLDSTGGRKNSAWLVPVPRDVVIEIGPLVAAPGTVAVMWLSSINVNVAATPLKRTLVAPLKLLPVIETLVPGAPLVGEKFAITAVATNV